MYFLYHRFYQPKNKPQWKKGGYTSFNKRSNWGPTPTFNKGTNDVWSKLPWKQNSDFQVTSFENQKRTISLSNRFGSYRKDPEDRQYDKLYKEELSFKIDSELSRFDIMGKKLRKRTSLDASLDSDLDSDYDYSRQRRQSGKQKALKIPRIDSPLPKKHEYGGSSIAQKFFEEENDSSDNEDEFKNLLKDRHRHSSAKGIYYAGQKVEKKSDHRLDTYNAKWKRKEDTNWSGNQTPKKKKLHDDVPFKSRKLSQWSTHDKKSLQLVKKKQKMNSESESIEVNNSDNKKNGELDVLMRKLKDYHKQFKEEDSTQSSESTADDNIYKMKKKSKKSKVWDRLGPLDSKSKHKQNVTDLASAVSESTDIPTYDHELPTTRYRDVSSAFSNDSEQSSSLSLPLRLPCRSRTSSFSSVSSVSSAAFRASSPASTTSLSASSSRDSSNSRSSTYSSSSSRDSSSSRSSSSSSKDSPSSRSSSSSKDSSKCKSALTESSKSVHNNHNKTEKMTTDDDLSDDNPEYEPDEKKPDSLEKLQNGYNFCLEDSGDESDDTVKNEEEETMPNTPVKTETSLPAFWSSNDVKSGE